ncbi:MAG: HK97 family phage prohead protease [Muribaculaceae bacterium]
MDKRLIWTNEGLNCYGFWVLTSGIDMSRFDKNPIMLFNHHRTWAGKKDEILPIGKWKDYNIDNEGVITGVPVFDKKDDFAAKIANKVEGDFLSACSIGIRIIEISEDPKYLKQGQLRATVTKCELREVSVVDIPANPSAAGIVLYDQNDKVITLSDGMDDCPIRLINNKNKNKMKEVALKLGLPIEATEAEMLAAVTSLQEKHAKDVAALKADKDKAEAEVKRLNDEKVSIQKTEAVALVDQAVKDGKITADLKEVYLNLFETAFENTKKILGGVPVRQGLRDRIPAGGVGEEFAKLSWDELDRKGLLAELKEKHPDLYEQKYKAMCAEINIQNQ